MYGALVVEKYQPPLDLSRSGWRDLDTRNYLYLMPLDGHRVISVDRRSVGAVRIHGYFGEEGFLVSGPGPDGKQQYRLFGF